MLPSSRFSIAYGRPGPPASDGRSQRLNVAPSRRQPYCVVAVWEALNTKRACVPVTWRSSGEEIVTVGIVVSAWNVNAGDSGLVLPALSVARIRSVLEPFCARGVPARGNVRPGRQGTLL